MKCIVPLAGPDLFTEGKGYRPLTPIDGETLIAKAIESRNWRPALNSDDFVFVIRDVGPIEDLKNALLTRWPGARIVLVSHQTGGALFSAMAGLAYVSPDEPVIVDLADILFTSSIRIPDDATADGVGMLVPTFKSDDPVYSYLRSEDGRVVEAAEKRVISERASAGVYIFRSPQAFLIAATHSLDHADALAHRGALFICPMSNGVIAAGLDVQIPAVDDVIPFGKSFHNS